MNLAATLLAQEESTLEGTVTFITANNIYVKFDSTEDIAIGEKLQFSGEDCLQVTDKSTSSVLCTTINNCVVKTGDKLTFTFISETKKEEKTDPIVEDVVPIEITDPKPVYQTEESLYTESIRGRISAATYNTFSEVRENRNRFYTAFSIDADHIDNSKFSIQTYLAYRGISLPPESTYSGRTSIFSLYNLNVRFDATPTLSVTGGRAVNPKAYSVGPVDGLQVEKYFGNFYVGAIGGFRPNFSDFGFNSDLVQYGGYFGIESATKEFYSQTTLGAIQQTNAGATDRRYIYFQHNSTIASNLNLFSSVELDIFSNNGGGTRLTNLYLSARYRFSRAANLMVSYDSRKQIIYYETFQTEVERLLDDDMARQGIRARLNLRPAKILWVGISYSSRFQNDSENKSDNIFGYITLTKVPKIGGRLNVSGNRNASNYLKSTIVSTRYSRDLVKNQLNAEVYYRFANYMYENRDMEYQQNYIGGGLSYRISRTWQFNISGELSQFEDESNFRLYARLTKRFYSKKKNK